jgi:hypothetical protein
MATNARDTWALKIVGLAEKWFDIVEENSNSGEDSQLEMDAIAKEVSTYPVSVLR